VNDEAPQDDWTSLWESLPDWPGLAYCVLCDAVFDDCCRICMFCMPSLYNDVHRGD
jgi:hypothetical protein